MNTNVAAYKTSTPWTSRQRALFATAVLVLVTVIGFTASKILYELRSETMPAIESGLSGKKIATLKQAMKKGGEVVADVATDSQTRELLITMGDTYWKYSPIHIAGQVLKDLCYNNAERCLDVFANPKQDTGK